MKMDTSDFDLDKYLRASNRVDLSSVEWDRIREHPVAIEEARCLTYMMDIETHTVVFLRDLLATRASFDPEVTAFLSCWAYEELWHGEAFSRFLGQAGYRVPPSYEHVEVRQGTLLIGMGDRLDVKKTLALAAGDSATAPAGMHHYSIAKGPTVLSVTFMGPYTITYLHAEEAPRPRTFPFGY